MQLNSQRIYFNMLYLKTYFSQNVKKCHGSFRQMLLVSNFSYVMSVYVFLNIRQDKALQGLKQGKDYKLPIILFIHKERREINCCGKYFCPLKIIIHKNYQKN